MNQAAFPRSIRRIVVEVASPVHSQGVGGMQHFTYRPTSENTYEEEKLYRGVHPMMGKRLHLWRLSNFKIERLPSVEDVYLLHAVARDNPKDERLFACAEVRDVTPVRDESGRIVSLPHLERMLGEAIAAMRLFQSQRPVHQHLCWNRIFLYVWQPLTLDRAESRELIRRLAPATEGLGLEQVVIRARIPSPATGELRDMIVRISSPGAPPEKVWETSSWTGLANWKAEMPQYYQTAARMLGVTENKILGPADLLLKRTAEAAGSGHTFYRTNVGIFQPAAGEPGNQTFPDPFFGGEGPDRTTCLSCGGCMMGCRLARKILSILATCISLKSTGRRFFPRRRSLTSNHCQAQRWRCRIRSVHR